MEPHAGWPVAEIVSVTRSKVGDHPTCDRAEVTFRFDTPIYEWEVRANSTDRHDGVFIARGRALGERRGFGRQRFGATYFGRYEVVGALMPVVPDSLLGMRGKEVLTRTDTARGTATVTVARDDLLHGPNEITVYCRATPTDPWSTKRPVPSP